MINLIRRWFLYAESPSSVVFLSTDSWSLAWRIGGIRPIWPSRNARMLSTVAQRGRRSASLDDSAAKGAGHRNVTWLFENWYRICWVWPALSQDSSAHQDRTITFSRSGSQPKPSWLPLFLGGARPNVYYCRKKTLEFEGWSVSGGMHIRGELGMYCGICFVISWRLLRTMAVRRRSFPRRMFSRPSLFNGALST